jgi:hypothetical protein
VAIVHTVCQAFIVKEDGARVAELVGKMRDDPQVKFIVLNRFVKHGSSTKVPKYAPIHIDVDMIVAVAESIEE